MMLFTVLARRLNPNLVIKRFRREPRVFKSWPNDWVPFVWNRPETVPGYSDTGDLVNLAEPDPDQPRPELRVSKKLNQLDKDDPLRKLLSLEHSSRSVHSKSLAMEQTQKLGVIHNLDHANSLEAKIIDLTFKLRKAQEKIRYAGENNTRYNGSTRMRANSHHHRRYRYLCELKELHTERHARIVEALNLEPKDNPINVPYVRPFRKKLMRKLAIEYARDLKERKVEEFMQSLEIEKKEFQEFKKNTLKWIEEEERKLNL